jgi:hypothetical protein
VAKPFSGRLRQDAGDQQRTDCNGGKVELSLPIERQIEREFVAGREAPAWMRNCQNPSPLGILTDGQQEATFESCRRRAKRE